MQEASSHHYANETGPVWLIEGSAEFASFAALAMQSKFTLEQVHTDRVSYSRGMLTPLRAVSTTLDVPKADTLYPYIVGYLAVEYLTKQYASGNLQKLEEFWKAQGTGAPWQSAFQQVFGITVDDFYGDFDGYRSHHFPPYCGPVGETVPSTTRSGPFTHEFVRRLAPGSMFELLKPWTEARNIPYVFCIPGMELREFSDSIYYLPSESAGSALCGDGCVTVYMKPTAPAGTYNFSIKLPDLRHAQVLFDHQP